MNLLGTYRAAVSSEEFKARVIAAVVLSAQNILNDSKWLSTPRMRAALDVLNNPTGHPWVMHFVWRVAANAAIASTANDNGEVTATDNDIEYVVAGVWSSLFPQGDTSLPQN